MNPPTKVGPTPETTQSNRRRFFVKATAIVIGGLVALVPLAAGLVALLDPLRRKSATGGFARIARLDALPADGIPRRFAVLADRVDAWNFFPSEPIGAVYLRRTSDDAVEALNSICPHAGCFVDFDRQADCFQCPCHNSEFTLSGAIVEPSPSPRPMDTLAVELRGEGNAKEVWIRFENFYPGIAKKIPKA